MTLAQSSSHIHSLGHADLDCDINAEVDCLNVLDLHSNVESNLENDLAADMKD